MDTANIKKNVTIADVARKAGVAISTVSRAFNNKEGLIKKETKERILKIAKELNYTPNALARGLALKRSENIGFLVKDIDNPQTVPFFSDIFAAATWEASKNNCNILFDSIKCDNKKWDGSLPKMIQEQNVEGVLLCGNFEPEIAETIENLGIKVILIDNHFNEGSFDTVFVNNVDAAFTAVEYLIGLNHKKIGFISDSLQNISFKERFQGYKKALRKYKIEVDSNIIIHDVHSDYTKFLEKKDKIMKVINEKPTAIFCAQDRLAINLIRLLNEEGYKVPEDISIIGFDDIYESQFVIPPLTTIRVFRNEMGSMGTKLLLERIFKFRKEPISVKLSYELVERESCRKI